MMKNKYIQNGFLFIGVLLIIISTISLIFGYRIRELWPTTVGLYETGGIMISGAVGVIFLGIYATLRALFFGSHEKKKIVE
jgi:hypothetical protein